MNQEDLDLDEEEEEELFDEEEGEEMMGEMGNYDGEEFDQHHYPYNR